MKLESYGYNALKRNVSSEYFIYSKQTSAIVLSLCSRATGRNMNLVTNSEEV